MNKSYLNISYFKEQVASNKDFVAKRICYIIDSLSDWLQTIWKSAYIYTRACFRFLLCHSLGTSYWTAELNTACIIHEFSSFLLWFSAFTCLRSTLRVFFKGYTSYVKITLLNFNQGIKINAVKEANSGMLYVACSILWSQQLKNARILRKCLFKIQRENTVFDISVTAIVSSHPSVIKACSPWFNTIFSVRKRKCERSWDINVPNIST